MCKFCILYAVKKGSLKNTVSDVSDVTYLVINHVNEWISKLVQYE